MKKQFPFLTVLLLTIALDITGQSIEDSIATADADSLMLFLSSDRMGGRVNYTPQQKRAASFLAQKFDEYGVAPFIGLSDYYHIFKAYSPLDSLTLPNIVGMLPGRSLPNEFIIYSAHYDHISGREIHNGANDNASGTTAVLLLARYFAMRKDNERTLVFCLFAGEELGLLGSRAFARLVQPDVIKAVINIEMIGVCAPNRKKSFFITGRELSDLSKILIKANQNTGVTIRKEPSGANQLFQRSDNYSFALSGIPAHSIMTGDDRGDPCYHRPCDDYKNIDIPNMTLVIRAIARCTHALNSGEATPKKIRLR